MSTHVTHSLGAALGSTHPLALRAEYQPARRSRRVRGHRSMRLRRITV